MSSIKFFVKEDDKDFPVWQMTEPESAAIGECVDDLVPHESKWADKYWFEADLCLLDEDEAPYGVLHCFTHNPSPKNGSLLESRIPHAIPEEVLQALSGKTFVVHPRQLGLNPWGKKVEIVFESILPAEKPVNGIKASVLIAAALKQ